MAINAKTIGPRSFSNSFIEAPRGAARGFAGESDRRRKFSGAWLGAPVRAEPTTGDVPTASRLPWFAAAPALASPLASVFGLDGKGDAEQGATTNAPTSRTAG